MVNRWVGWCIIWVGGIIWIGVVMWGCWCVVWVCVIVLLWVLWVGGVVICILHRGFVIIMLLFMVT